MNTSRGIGIAPEDQKAIVAGLSRVLADSYTLSPTTPNYHWHRVGRGLVGPGAKGPDGEKGPYGRMYDSASKRTDYVHLIVCGGCSGQSRTASTLITAATSGCAHGRITCSCSPSPTTRGAAGRRDAPSIPANAPVPAATRGTSSRNVTALVVMVLICPGTKGIGS